MDDVIEMKYVCKEETVPIEMFVQELYTRMMLEIHDDERLIRVVLMRLLRMIRNHS